MSSLRRKLGWTLVGLSLLLHVFTVYCYTRQPDRLAAFTVMPIWLWGGIGLLMSSVAFYFLRAALSLVVTAVWAVTLLVGADEARVLANFGKAAPEPGPAAPHEGQAVLRVLTANCGHFKHGNPTTDIAAWNPDILLLQEVWPHQAQQIAKAVFGEEGEVRSHQSNAVATRWEIDASAIPLLDVPGRNQQVVINLPGGGSVAVVNVHLATAATDLRLWEREAWRKHRSNRALRRQELALALSVLDQTTEFPAAAAIFGGDFNAPATDIVHYQLARDFDDAFSAAGTGWGNTYHRRLPVLRIDHIYATRHFTPVRARAVDTRESDHRMVVADFLMPKTLP